MDCGNRECAQWHSNRKNHCQDPFVKVERCPKFEPLTTEPDTVAKLQNERGVRQTDHKCRPETAGELIKFLESFDPETRVMPLNYGEFRYVLDGKSEGVIQFA